MKNKKCQCSHKDKKHQNIRHGAFSPTCRKRLDDGRSTDGKALANTMRNLVDDLGGERNLTGPMRILINSNVRPKLITLMLINNYINLKQNEILDDQGNLIPALSKSYISFSNALRLDLQALNDMAARAGKTNKNIPTIESIIAGNIK